jgi:hypothetical protein
MQQVAKNSYHLTPSDLKEEIKKMPAGVPIFVGHLKPNYRSEICDEVEAIEDERITIIGDDTSYIV